MCINASRGCAGAGASYCLRDTPARTAEHHSEAVANGPKKLAWKAHNVSAAPLQKKRKAVSTGDDACAGRVLSHLALGASVGVVMTLAQLVAPLSR